MGRTGTFIVIDAMMDMMYAEQKVDVFEFVARIRNQRPQMVQTDVSPACPGPALSPLPHRSWSELYKATQRPLQPWCRLSP